METSNTNGADEVGNGKQDRDDFHDAEDGNCLNIPKPDEGDALGKFGASTTGHYARMPVDKYATHYKMNHKRRGLAYIFNHEIFECGNLKSRAGTNEDCKNLKARLTALGFDVHVFKDLKLREIEHHLEDAARVDHTHNDCLLVAVLSHGETNIIYARDTHYKSDCLWSPFTGDKCPTLAGKPKIFLLQACQGDKLDGGVMLQKTETDGEFQHNSYRIPAQADFLIVYSTVKGYYSWRNTTKGSWFVQALCDELEKKAHEYDLLTILTFVSQRVAIDFESNVPDCITMHRQKQIPCVMSMLTRLIKFK